MQGGHRGVDVEGVYAPKRVRRFEVERLGTADCELTGCLSSFALPGDTTQLQLRTISIGLQDMRFTPVELGVARVELRM